MPECHVGASPVAMDAFTTSARRQLILPLDVSRMLQEAIPDSLHEKESLRAVHTITEVNQNTIPMSYPSGTLARSVSQPTSSVDETS
jgi:hypothetical protein